MPARRRLHHADNFSFKCDRAAGERMIEIEQRIARGLFDQGSRKLRPAGIGERDLAAHLVVQRPRQGGQRDTTDQIRIAQAEPGLGFERETAPFALAHSKQTGLQGRGQLPAAQGQRSRAHAERAHCFGAVVQTYPVAQREKTVGFDQSRRTRHRVCSVSKTTIVSQAMAITDWPESERPRERLLRNGAAALSDAELLAIFLRVGVRGKSAVDLARDLLARFGGLNRLFAARRVDFDTVPGVGDAKFTQFQAVIEMARRALAEELGAFSSLSSPRAVRDYLTLSLAAKQHEAFMVLFLDAQHKLIATEEMFRGTLTQTSVYPREVVKRALAHNAAALILAHNHPSGVAEPSQADRMLTDTLKSALALVDIAVLDHVIVAGRSTLSFAERGLL